MNRTDLMGSGAVKPANVETTPIVVQGPPRTPDGRRIVVAVAVPSGDMVDTDFAMSMASMMAATRLPLVLVSAKGCYVDLGRMKCVEDAKRVKIQTPDDGVEHPVTHLFFLDSDMVFPKVALVRLLSHNKDVVGALYSRRVSPWTNLGQSKDKTIERASTGLVEMDWLATGCMLIDMKVFQKIPEFDDDGPVFGYKWLPELKAYEREDIRFCRLCRENGVEIWGDIDLSGHVGHIGQAIYQVDERSKKEAAQYGVGGDRVENALPERKAAAE